MTKELPKAKLTEEEVAEIKKSLEEMKKGECVTLDELMNVRVQILAHRRVLKFLKNLKDEKLKNKFKEIIQELSNYPIVLKKFDVEKT